ncbi:MULTISPECIES: VOC family protein [unclassified Avibacterium]|uniref:VOC family protein n=1 Tax=unclassified Avibacterium TaxID=2685287 RepID=UPI0020266CAF|nr:MULTISPECIES: VOC family protein [unclassified Avibacterium]MCW9698326.1 VOC family protein [Avibacterium sp. 20-129]MCW9718493.1 VOC family protein [Avibacterium sp. 21-599]URL07429.1 VOC family protein [Avibacterium sp. 21-595]
MISREQNFSFFDNPFFSYDEFAKFEQQILRLAEKMALPLQDYVIDHLAVRVNSEQSAQRWLSALLTCGEILSDNIVNGRKIYLIQLDTPLTFANQQVQIIELPFPKNKHYPQEGWEHIEAVIPFLPKETTNAWVERINSHFLWNKMTDVSVKVSEPKVEGERLPNPSIAVSCDHSTCIKVHPYHIKTIVAS